MPFDTTEQYNVLHGSVAVYLIDIQLSKSLRMYIVLLDFQGYKKYVPLEISYLRRKANRFGILIILRSHNL